MSIQQNLKNRLTIAIKEQNVFERDLIRVILTEFSNSKYADKDKNIDDDMALKILAKLNSDMITTNTEQTLKESEFVEKLLPSKMNESDIKNNLVSIIDELKLEKSPKNIGILKKEFDSKYKCQDGKVVGKLCKELMS